MSKLIDVIAVFIVVIWAMQACSPKFKSKCPTGTDECVGFAYGQMYQSVKQGFQNGTKSDLSNDN